MQYEIVILELLTRIKKLEEEVNELKQVVFSPPDMLSSTEDVSRFAYEENVDTSVSYRKMTDEMIDICYKCGKMLAAGESVQELADGIHEETGMNRNSAIMYLYAVQGMLDGTIYKRAINAKATKKYYDNIFNEYGSVGLKKALYATKLHIEYRKDCGHTVDSIEEIYNQYEARL